MFSPLANCHECVLLLLDVFYNYKRSAHGWPHLNKDQEEEKKTALVCRKRLNYIVEFIFHKILLYGWAGVYFNFCSFLQGDLLRGIDNCLGVIQSVVQVRYKALVNSFS